MQGGIWNFMLLYKHLTTGPNWIHTIKFVAIKYQVSGVRLDPCLVGLRLETSAEQACSLTAWRDACSADAHNLEFEYWWCAQFWNIILNYMFVNTHPLLPWRPHGSNGILRCFHINANQSDITQINYRRYAQFGLIQPGENIAKTHFSIQSLSVLLVCNSSNAEN